MSKSLSDQSQSLVDRLRREHAEMDRRVHELDRRPFLSPSEQMERVHLKKLKLAAKDQLARLEDTQ